MPRVKMILSFVTLLAAPVATAESAKEFTFIPKQIISGGYHNCALSTKGQVKCWGDNAFGETGVGSTVRHGRDPDTMGKNLPVVNLGKDVKVGNMCAGDQFTCALTADGRVKCWGDNRQGQLGQERATTRVGQLATDMGDNLPYTNLGENFITKDLQCGEEFACALNTAGKVKCWGRADNGQLGVNTAVSIGGKTGEMGDKLPYLALPGPATQIATGKTHACAIAKGSIYCWGENTYGQVGIESTAAKIVLPIDTTTTVVPVKLEDSPTPLLIDFVRAGFSHTCAGYRIPGLPTASNQKIKCWGRNLDGELGLSLATANLGKAVDTMGAKLPAVNLGMADMAQLETHEAFSCALSKQGAVKCWGTAAYGQIGSGDNVSRGNKPNDMGKNLPSVDLGLPAIAISTGGQSAYNSCALLLNHEVKCWGYGSDGSLGYEDAVLRGRAPGEMGENLPYVLLK